MTRCDQQVRPYLIRAVSEVHCGTGQGLGDIDLPTAKEALTGLPLIPGSTVKGVLRDNAEDLSDDFLAAFGPPPESADEYASALHFTDARMLYLPVRSFAGVFACVTSPLILQRLARDLARGPLAGEAFPEIPDVGKEEAIVRAGSSIVFKNKVLLEELDLAARSDQPGVLSFFERHLLTEAWDKDMVLPRLVIVHDDVLSFLCETALPVRARIRIDQKTGTVAKGALWYEESLPAETMLFGLVVASPPRKKECGGDAASLLGKYASGSRLLQFGGKATTGNGICEMRFVAGGAA